MIEKSKSWPLSEEQAEEALKTVMEDKGAEALTLMFNHAMTCGICGPKFFMLMKIQEEVVEHLKTTTEEQR